jgi:hypothetical protein
MHGLGARGVGASVPPDVRQAGSLRAPSKLLVLACSLAKWAVGRVGVRGGWVCARGRGPRGGFPPSLPPYKCTCDGLLASYFSLPGTTGLRLTNPNESSVSTKTWGPGMVCGPNLYCDRRKPPGCGFHCIAGQDTLRPGACATPSNSKLTETESSIFTAELVRKLRGCEMVRA